MDGEREKLAGHYGEKWKSWPDLAIFCAFFTVVGNVMPFLANIGVPLH